MNRPGHTMSLQWYIPAILHLNRYIFYNELCQGCINAGTLCHQGRLMWGQGVPEHSYGDTLFRDVPSPHRWKVIGTVGWRDILKLSVPVRYEFYGTPVPQINRPWWYNVPALMHPCHYALYDTYRLMHNDWYVSLQGNFVSETINLGDGNTSSHDTSFRDVPSPRQ